MKRTLSLVIALVMCLSLVFSLSSCGSYDKTSILELVDPTYAGELDEPAVLLSNFKLEGDVYASGNEYVVTSEDVTDPDMPDKTRTEYRIYSVSLGKVISSLILEEYNEELDDDKQIYSVDYYFQSDYAYQIITYYSGNNKVEIFNKDGVKIITDKDVSYVDLREIGIVEYDNHLTFNEKLYREEADGKITFVRNYRELELAQLNSSYFRFVGDKYVYANGKEIIVYDASLNFKSYYKYETTYNNYVESVVLANGNVLLMVEEYVSEDSKEYDLSTIVTNGYNYVERKALHSVYVYDAEEGKLSEAKDLKNVFAYEVYENDDFIDGIDSSKVTNLVKAQKIENKKIVEKDYLFDIDNNGNIIKEIEYEIGMEYDYEFVTLGDKLFVEYEYGTVVFDKEGNRLAVLDEEYRLYTDSYVVYEDRIADLEGKTVLSFDGYDFERCYTSGVVILSKYGKDGREYFIWKNGVITNLNADDVDTYFNWYIVEKVDKDTSVTTTEIYDITGKLLTSYTSADNVDYEIEGEYLRVVKTDDQGEELNTVYGVK